MGDKLLDKYSLLHFAVGVIFRFLNISLKTSFWIHVFFELIENSREGVKFIDEKLTFWPGGKQKSDTHLNSFGDTIFFVLGWLVADYLH